MLISFKVEKLVVAAIPDLVETWTQGFGFVPVEGDQKRSLDKINLMVFPGTMLLKKPLFENQKAHRRSSKLFFTLLRHVRQPDISPSANDADVSNKQKWKPTELLLMRS